MAVVLAEHADEAVDLVRVVKMLLVINALQNLAADTRLSPAERDAAQRLLSDASRQLDYIDKLYKREIEELRWRRAVRGTVLE